MDETDDPYFETIRDLLNNLMNKVALKELDEHYDFSGSTLNKILTENRFDESIIELDEYFRNIEEIITDESNTFYISYFKCDACKTKHSLYWRRVAREKIVCNECFYEKAYLILFDDEHLNKKIKISDSASSSSNNSKQSANKNKNKKMLNQNPKQKNKNLTASNRPLTRTSTNIKSQLSSCSSSSLATEEISRKSPKNVHDSIEIESSGNRRNKLFKKNRPVRNDIFVSKLNTSDYVFHRGFYIQIGDIVALRDIDEKENVYFAQIRAFLSDQYGQKSAILTWLIPNNDNYKRIKTLNDFDPSLFELGPAEEFPRSLDCMEFVTRLNGNPLVKSDLEYFNVENKYNNDLLRHKFELDDLAKKNFRLIATKYYDNTCQNIKTDYEFKV
ncbi:unnamed protein product [Brachionus calyciflorus]|uniref:GATA zinc finger domain-containing protein 1 n=1 Tax=Brachionus calyciflorus TaxID=104777 RepID=A0A813MAI1_9BILA|nr:unnamed protein product [Brachionus calyciflorus]